MAQLIHRRAVVLLALSILALYGWEAHARRAVDLGYTALRIARIAT